ncbi:probable ADP-ribosylation factor GTPase-activating protein AGD14 [Herrania umbratica]|uniref:Probable ADP-ribosylation factor GTPase-activating protein AGD14 n=1 Tax=Herrania umbratica TaxID=108875 RepID=A0A6J0ZLM3_9ROSI|nr:probable ADP-ribosylation factor GTPase-activating protein AGD14 [Herrania umbratica]
MMASRVKEDEKNERIIRGLLKQQENRRCINCNSLGPQYVCTNFWTFVCTTCSGIHREFTHRVKSVSMAKFTSQEVSALQDGGNQRAKDIYFKEWDPQRNSVPDSRKKECTFNRGTDFVLQLRMAPREKCTDETAVANSGLGNDVGMLPRLQPGIEQGTSITAATKALSDGACAMKARDEFSRDDPPKKEYQAGMPGRAPANHFGKMWRNRGQQSTAPATNRGIKGVERFISKFQRGKVPPVVRPVREILGENVIPLRISEPPKANGSRTVDVPQTQRTASSSSLGSTSGNPAEVKLETTVSLIDFDADPEPAAAQAVTQTQRTTVTQSVVQPTSSTNDNNWASFDFAPQTIVSQAPSNMNTLDSVLSQLSVPASVPGHISGPSTIVGGQIPAPVVNMSVAPLGGNPNVAFTGQIPVGAGASAVAPVSNLSTLPPTGALAAAPGLTPIMPVTSGSSQASVNNAGQWPNVQHQQTSFFSAASSQSTAQQFMPPVDGASTSQPWNFVPSQHMQGHFSAPAAQTPQAVSQSVLVFTSTGASQPPSIETKASGRKELPADFFTATYPTYPTPAAGWQTGPPRGMGFTMQYSTAVPMSAFPQSSKSVNPFDLGGEAPPVQNQTFPSMASLQGAMPNVPPASGLVRASSLGTPSSAWMPRQALPYASGMPSQLLPYASAVPPRAYIGAQLPSNLPPSSHQIGIGSEASFGFVNADQQVAGRFSAPTTPQPFSSVGGNPFG